MLQLNNLTSAGKGRKRRGRGGKRGGTAGKGHKGQKARSGGNIDPRFEGGQMPLCRRLPKRGFTNARFKQDVCIINLDLLETHFEDDAYVDKKALFEKGLLKGSGRFVLKVLGKGALSKKLTVVADAFSASASKAIQDLGGQAKLAGES